MNEPIEKLEYLLNQFDDIDYKEMKLDRSIAKSGMILSFLMLLITFLLDPTKDSSFIAVFTINSFFISLFFLCSYFFYKIKKKISKIQSQKKTQYLELINKKFIFDLFLSFEKLYPFLLKKSKISILKANIEQVMDKPNYKELVLSLIQKFKQDDFSIVKSQIQSIIDKEKASIEYKKHKQDSEYNHLEMNLVNRKEHFKSTL